jgi:outer membrane lipoprotein SlyB
MKRILLICLLASGCASSPIVDPKSSKTPGNYYADRTECEAIAGEVSYSWEMFKGAAVQGILGGFIGATGGGHGAQIGAASGAIVGAGKGAWNTQSSRADIVRKCLAGRGYSVLK